MWRTPNGERVLVGGEAKLIKAALTGMVEPIMNEIEVGVGQWMYGVQLFDELPPSQRLALLDRIATHLLTDTANSLELTAVNEAAVGVIFAHILEEIAWEIDEPNGITPTWRELVLEAHESVFHELPELFDDEKDSGEVTALCDDLDEWSWILEALADAILWDRDYEMEDMFLDATPETSELMKAHLGINEEYYSAVAPDTANDEGLEHVRRHLKDLVSN